MEKSTHRVHTRNSTGLHAAAFTTLYVAAILLIGYFDSITGATPEFTIVYLVPIVLAASQLSFRTVAVLAALAFLVDLRLLVATPGHETLFNAYVDGFLHFTIFMAVAYGTWRLRSDYRQITELKNRLTEDMEIAKVTQRSILQTKLPALGDMDVGVKIVFSKAVGGDFCDVMAVNKECYVLVIADISGKSLAAALFTALLRDDWQKTVRAVGALPGEIVGQLNQRLLEQLPPDMFVTLFVALIEPATGKIEYINAGHEPGILVKEGEPPVFLTTPEPMVLGLSAESAVCSRAITMPPGSVLFLYTDGLIDPPSADFGTEAIIKVVKATGHSTAQEIADAVYAERFAAELSQRDDVTILCLKRPRQGQA